MISMSSGRLGRSARSDAAAGLAVMGSLLLIASPRSTPRQQQP
jgi:hypothetical protein